ncbi:MAG: NUDIX hydrolase [Anaerolineae bacterium]|nr:NUDIX hydrolase [Anaerolineae bacterium]MCO5197199.1 NUDIX hydrolase [Anaerolineae bacterium]MCO5206300.1 NUDIX hydrolase [Anaerolineae bacterium]
MFSFRHEWSNSGITYTFTGLETLNVPPDRVKTVAFTRSGKILLVTNSIWSPQCWLPGGGVEDGETPEEALARELVEEANATLHQRVKIGAQRIDESTGKTWYETFYWSRVTVAQSFAPQTEVTERHLVTPDAFLDRLFWGRLDPKAPILLQRAQDVERRFSGL